MRWSIRAHLIALVVTVLVPTLVFSGFMLSSLARVDQEETQKDALHIARILAAAVDREATGVLRAIQTLATSERLRRHDYEGFHRQAREVAELLGTTIVFKLPSGQQLINTDAPWGSPLGVVLHDADKKVLELKRPHISDLIQGTMTGRLLATVNIPLFDENGAIKGLLTSGFSPDRFSSLMQRSVPSPWLAALVDRNGKFMGVNRLPDALIGQRAAADFLNASKDAEGLWSGISSQGISLAGAYVTFDGGWRVGTALPTSVIKARQRKNIIWLATLGLLALTASVLFASLFGGQISKPLNKLAAALPEIGHGVVVTAIPATPIREVKSIADALADTSEKLRISHGRRDQAEHALRRNSAELQTLNQRFQAIMDHAPVDIAVKDTEGRYILINRSFETSHGLSAAKVLGKTAADIFPKERADVQATLDRQVLQTKTAVQTEMAISGPNGTQHILFTKFPLISPDGNVEAICAITTDLTEKRVGQIRLAQVEKMQAVGQLTGGIAHDFNNLLTVILANAEILVDEVRSEHRELAQTIMHAAERGADLTQRLLAFARRQVLTPRPTKVPDLLKEMLPLLQRSVGERVSLVISFPPTDIWNAEVDPVQLETAILNLALNARDAMPEGGKLIIETGNFRLPKDEPHLVDDLEPGDYVALSVSDTGTGMTPSTVAQAFEPFFTTKELGKGTGLGLSMVYGFAKQSKGHVKIYSEVGRGTTIRMFLPRTTEGAFTTVSERETGTLPRGNELILLVEDDPLVRNNTRQLLAALGYRVLTAESGVAALQMPISEPPDLLLTDIVMPHGLDGYQLAAQLRERWPTLHVLFTSGYAHGATIAPHDIEGDFIGKPFRRAELAVKLRRALDENSADQNSISGGASEDAKRAVNAEFIART